MNRDGPGPSRDREGADSPSPVRDAVIQALKTVYDPELPVNIYDLGLIYDLNISDAGQVEIKMTLTAPNCPMADMIVAQVDAKVRQVEGVSDASVELVWDPPWTRERMSEAARLHLNMPLEQENPSRLRVLRGGGPPRP